MYKIGMIIAIAGLVVGWIAYGIYRVISGRMEKKQFAKKSERLEAANKSFENYTKKMADYELKPYDKK